MWKEAVLACFEVLFWHTPGGTEENKNCVRTAVVIEILTWDLIHVKWESYPFDHNTYTEVRMWSCTSMAWCCSGTITHLI
jgi:hypothetical protein